MSTAVAIAMGVFVAAPCQASEKSGETELKLGVECGWVTVARDAAEPGGKTVRLWTARIKALNRDAKRPDPILYINGGPGVATVDSILPNLLSSKTFTALRRERDIILFDQRGSGRSEEVLCPDLGKRLNSVADEGLSPPLEEQLKRALFVECRRALERRRIALRNYTTAATVGDLEHIRKAFRVNQWNLVAISYGALVAMHAMRTTPSAIRSVVLNSPYPPNSVTWAEQASSTAAAYMAIDEDCSRQAKCRERFGSLIPKLEATLARLETAPLQDGKRRITGRLFAEALWPLAVQSSTVHFVPLAIDRAHAGDSDVIKGLVRKFASGDAFGGRSPAQAMAISCYEGGRTREWFARARRLYPALVSASPDDTWDRLCDEYRPGFAPAGFFAPVASNIPTLMYAGALDAATPVVDAYQASRFLSKATVVVVEGAAHGPMGKDECTRAIALAFLGNPETPPDGQCLAKRPVIDFAQEGLGQLLTPTAK